jgi:hypothetical protein
VNGAKSKNVSKAKRKCFLCFIFFQGGGSTFALIDSQTTRTQSHPTTFAGI